MPKKKKKPKITSFQVYLIVSLSSAILILLLLIIFKAAISNWLLNFFITYESSPVQKGEPKQNIIEKIFSPKEAAPSPIGPIGTTSQTPLQGSFTELFSGVGWRNPVTSNVYQDFKTLTISFPPAYTLEETNLSTYDVNILTYDVNRVDIDAILGSRASEFYSVSAIKVGSRTFVGGVKKVGEQYEGYLYEVVNGKLQYLDSRCPTADIGCPLFSSQYPGKIVFGSDGSSKLFLLYAAYEGKAFEINLKTSDVLNINDYSAIFNARVTEEGKIAPQIFYKDGTWWIFSTNETPKLLRLRDGMANDLTDGVIKNLPGGLTSLTLTVAPAPEENAIYLIFRTSDVPLGTSDVQIFRLRDLGFSAKGVSTSGGKLIWESLRLNAWDGEIVRGRFTRIDDSNVRTSNDSNVRTSDVRSWTSDVPAIKYFLSNDGGKHWVEAELNKFVNFTTKGGDFRWRAELYPSDNRYESPWIKTVGVEYYIIRK